MESGQNCLPRAFNRRAASASVPLVGGLAKGYVEPDPDGTHTIHVTGCSVFAYDSFNFEGDDNYGYWNYEDMEFSNPLLGSKENYLTNAYFQEFRNKYDSGDDFCVLSHLQPVNNFIKMEYKYP